MKMGSKSRPRLALVMLMVLSVVVLASSSGLAAMIMTPYLQAVTVNSVYVLAECDANSPVTVEYGTTTAYGSKATTESTEATVAPQVTFVHNVKLTGLKPNTVYHYRVSQGGEPTGDYSFITAAEPGTGFRFAWMADCRGGTGIHDQIAARIREAQPRFSLYGGDICTDDSYNAFKQEFFRASQLPLIASVPFFLAAGNHEEWGANTQAFAQSPQSASGTQDFYSFDYGDAHFLCINNNVPYKAGTAQYDFVAKDLAGTRKPWKIVFAHVPAYAVGGHNEDPAMVELTGKFLEPNGVDLVLAGDSHFFEHNLVNGIHHLVVGTAGAELSTPTASSYTLKSAREYNYAIVDVTPSTLHLVVYNNAGGVLDTLDLAKTGTPAPPAVPVAPSRLACKGEPGKVSVSWQPSAWATSYTVKRGLSAQGPFTVLKADLTITRFVDTAVTAGTTYFYIVTATNAKGESPDSPPVSATPRVP